MFEEIAKAIPVYFSSMLKFIFGPFGGYLAGLNIVTTIIATVAGMMTVVFAFAYFGDYLRNKVFKSFFERRKLFSVRNRRFVTIWKKYGLLGLAALTPVVLTPIGGTLLAVSFGAPRKKLIFYMFVSAAAWAIILSMGVYYFADMLPDFLK